MKIHIVICHILLTFILASCSSEPPASNLLASPVRSYSVLLPPDAKPNPKSSTYLTSANTLYSLDYENQSISILDLSDNSPKSEKIELSADGPNGIGKAYSISVLSKDSIIVVRAGPGVLSIIDRSGKILETLRYDFSDEQEPDFTGFRNRHKKNVFLYRDSLLFFPQRVPFRGSRPESIDHRPIGYYDLHHKTFHLLDFKYPTEYWDQKLLNDFTFCGNGKYLYFGLAAQHFIWQIDLVSGARLKIPSKSSSFPEEFVGETAFGDVYERTAYLVTQPQYNSVLTDPHRDLVYRIAIIPYEDAAYAKSKSTQLFQYPDIFSVIVSRTDGTQVGEYTFPPRTYFPYGMFVSSEGLNLPKSHPEYLINAGSEDEVTYDVFDFSSIASIE